MLSDNYEVLIKLQFVSEYMDVRQHDRHVKAIVYAISSDTHQLQLIKLHHFKLEIFKSI